MENKPNTITLPELEKSASEIHICGNFEPITAEKPADWIDKNYKILVPYKFDWRETIGKVTCDCAEILECYQVWYGWTWYHSDDCALMKKVKARPQLRNLWQYANLPLLAGTMD